VPPLAGFFAKFYVFLAAIQAGLVIPAIIGVLASAVGLVYYLGLVKAMLLDELKAALDKEIAPASRAVMWLGLAVVVLFVVAASPVISVADAAAKVLLP
jgi:NADH-quinone oxidoreductase subunit N